MKTLENSIGQQYFSKKRIIQTSSKNALLVDVDSIDTRQLTEVLNGAGFNVSKINKDAYGKYSDCCSLIIVDVKKYGNNVLSYLKKIQKGLFGNSKLAPPILVVVDVSQNDKSVVFQLGAYDYISCPLITAELQRRLTQIIHFGQFAKVSLQDIELNEKKLLFERQCAHISRYNPDAKNDNQLAEKTALYLKSQLSNKVNLNGLTRTMATNRNKLAKVFKDSFGISMFHWLRKQRLLHAAELLETTSSTVLQIAEQVGYEDSNNFSTAFKRMFGLSPLQYRKKHEAKKKEQETKVGLNKFQ